MKTKERGFTLIELMIVIAIIAIIASIAIPNLMSSRLSANEAAAIATLRNLHAAQDQFHAMAIRDQDTLPPNGYPDGRGEFGGFMDLSGSIAPVNSGPNPTQPINPPILSGVFGIQDQPGDGLPAATRSGYWFRMYLPDQNGAPVAEPDGGFTAADPAAANKQESQWVCYAWPVELDASGTRVFVIDSSGEVHQTKNDAGAVLRYGGANAPGGDAAFLVGGSVMADAAGEVNRLASNDVGFDGNFYTSVGN